MTNLDPKQQVSRRRSLDQERAKKAWACVAAVKNRKEAKLEKEYSGLARSAPTDILTNGLGQTLAFWRAKGKEDKKSAHSQIFDHVSQWCKPQLKIGETHVSLLDWVVNTADTDGYRRATSEAMAFLGWLKRFAEAELKQETKDTKEATDERK
jgi:CRISPR-associated protein Cmr5